MELSLDVVQNLAPDQASLNAAKKLLSPAKWNGKGAAQEVNSIWGQCQGSGANPYYVMADIVDHGYKCTCPSRKFPCKHVLALMWQYSLDNTQFVPEQPPTWVSDWLGRRRKTSNASASQNEEQTTPPKKDIQLAGEEEKTTLSAEEQTRREQAKIKRTEQTRLATQKAISAGIEDFQQWVDDQLRIGIDALLKDIPGGCRQIASRMVDAKATGLAARLDEIPGKVMGKTLHEQADALLRELGKLVLLTDAWLADPDDPDAKRGVGTAEKREQVLNDQSLLRVGGRWLVMGNQTRTRRDGLISHTTWLVHADPEVAGFAQLLDFYPASAGRNNVGFATGTQIEAEMVFYASRHPLRAVMSGYKPVDRPDYVAWPVRSDCPHQVWRSMLNVTPWGEVTPVMPGTSHSLSCQHNQDWLRLDASDVLVKVTGDGLPDLIKGSELSQSFMLWDGREAEVFSCMSQQWGVLRCI